MRYDHDYDTPTATYNNNYFYRLIPTILLSIGGSDRPKVY
jgi:hypothetical protein